jgi:hypothetical protein
MLEVISIVLTPLACERAIAARNLDVIAAGPSDIHKSRPAARREAIDRRIDLDKRGGTQGRAALKR